VYYTLFKGYIIPNLHNGNDSVCLNWYLGGLTLYLVKPARKV